MRDAHLAGTVNNGAGIYGYPAPTHVTSCPNSNNAFGHHRDCSCGWYRASQSVPYMEPSPHENWWPDGGEAA